LNEYHLVSRNVTGGWPNGHSEDPSIDASGRFVTYASDATDLASPALPSEFAFVSQIWLWDRETERTSLISIGTDGRPGEDDSDRPLISADGTAIAFTSEADNMGAGDTRNQVYQADLSTGAISLVSQSAAGEPASVGRGILLHSISGDGSMVSFSTDATNLTPQVDEEFFQGYIWRRSAAVLEDAIVAANGAPPNRGSSEIFVNRDGTFAIFTSDSTNIGDPAIKTLNTFRRRILPQTVSASLFSSVLPSSRSIMVDTPFSLFATLIATADTSDCRLRLGAPGTSLSYRLSDPLTNLPSGPENPVFDLVANQPQSFLLELQANSAASAVEMPVLADCRSGASATTLPAINTFVLTASETPTPDVIALAATLNNDGILDLPASGDFGAFSIASINLGAAANMEVRASATGAALNDILLCETQPATGECLAPPSAVVPTQIDAGATPTFAVFARSESPVTFDPAGNRLIVEIAEAGGEVRGRTSVAIR